MSWNTATPPLKLSNVDIVVACERDDTGDALIRDLQHTRARVRHLWPIPARLPDDTDVIFCDFAPDLASRIPWVPGEPKAALVTILAREPSPDLELLCNCAPDAVLHRPFTAQATLTSLVLARAHFAYEQRLRSRIGKLDETLRTIRCVERAKAILMSRRKVREDEAYQFMRRQAMSRRVSISTIANAIVDSEEMLG
ncbi:MAG: ANTAR domain-containing protein [Betaproteobacteria bacterium]|nr:ANTAR domain-containing protein [Betaproteobacteria bacterium]